jgi:hypothetical protein
MSTWRERATPIIEDVLRITAGQDEKAIRVALRDAYPFGPRQYHPYRIWCDEVKRQRGLKKPADKAIPYVDERQLVFLDGGR